MNNNFKYALLGFACIALSGCETIPRAQRVANFEKDIHDRFIGKSVDEVILAFGPPDSRSNLTDGREVIQYETRKTGTRISEPRVRTNVSVGGVWGGGGYHHHGYPYGGVSVGIPFPNDNYSESRALTCKKRFTISVDKKVEDFAWEGNGCIY